MDSHVHVNQPGRTDWEGIETASRAAAAGGITTIVDMPLNSSPVNISRSALVAKQRSVERQAWVDLGFHGGVVGTGRGGQPASSPAEVEALIEAGVMGIKVFLCDSGIDEFPPVTLAELSWLMPLLAQFQVPLWVHAEVVPSEWRVPPVIQN
ncbi:MAG: amidohydrolase family protein, partial [bacterium]